MLIDSLPLLTKCMKLLINFDKDINDKLKNGPLKELQITMLIPHLFRLKENPFNYPLHLETKGLNSSKRTWIKKISRCA